MISETLQLDSNAQAKAAWYVPVVLDELFSFILKHNSREQLSDQIGILLDYLESLGELESYASQFVITGDIEFKLEYLDAFLERFGVRSCYRIR